MKNNCLLALVLAICFLTSCVLHENHEEILNLQKIDEYPFYIYYYPGDYGFEEYLQSGEYHADFMSQFAEQPFACSVFAAFGNDEQNLLGRNFDWHDHLILIVFTQPSYGYRSVSVVDIAYLGYDEQFTPLDDPGALTATPYFPFDGMNEKGLAVGMMSVVHAEGGNDPAKVTLGDLELMRLMLDYAGNVEEAVQLIRDYNVDFGQVPVHFLIADKSGASVVIEYIDGIPLVIPNEQDWQVSTNFLISEEQPEGATSSCWRFNLLEEALEGAQGYLDSTGAMELLKAVSQPGTYATRWSVVYDLTNVELEIAVGRNYESIYEFSLLDTILEN